MTNLEPAEKCTYVVTANTDAPGLRLKTSSAEVKALIEINYIEYKDTTYPLYAATKFIDGTNAANVPEAQLYEKQVSEGGGLPWFKQKI